MAFFEKEGRKISIITKPKTWADAENVTYTDLNSDLDTIYTEFNGNITDANIKSSAAIAVSKIATGLTGSLVGTTDTQVITNKTLTSPTLSGTPLITGWDGWEGISATLTYSSTDGHTFVAATSADLTALVGLGDRFKLTNQGAAQYFIVTAITATTITFYGGTTYSITNTAITAPSYSHAKAPFGFPLNPATWTETTTDSTDATQASPVNGTWYNLAAISLALPIGSWNVDYGTSASSNTSTSVANIAVTLSTANNTESDTQLTTNTRISAAGSTGINFRQTLTRGKNITVTAKTSYFLNAKSTDSASSIFFLGSTNTPTLIRAVCAYL